MTGGGSPQGLGDRLGWGAVMCTAILLVDDSPVARAVATEHLRVHGVPVTAVATAREAVDCDPKNFAGALLDLQLEDGSGTEVAVHFRRSLPDFPVAFLTAEVSLGHLTTAVALGPVFSKARGMDAAIDWAVGASRRTPRA